MSEIIRVTSYQSIADTCRFGGDPIVTIYVGAAQVPYNVHKHILCNVSPAFTAIFTGKFKKNSTNTVKLPEDDHEVFEWITQWLYTRNFELSLFGETKPLVRYLQLAKLYVAADKYGIEHLKDSVLEQWGRIKATTNLISNMSVVKYIYEHTPTSSKLREAIVADYAYSLDLQCYNQGMREDLNGMHDFAVDILIKMAARARLLIDHCTAGEDSESS